MGCVVDVIRALEKLRQKLGNLELWQIRDAPKKGGSRFRITRLNDVVMINIAIDSIRRIVLVNISHTNLSMGRFMDPPTAIFLIKKHMGGEYSI